MGSAIGMLGCWHGGAAVQRWRLVPAARHYRQVVASYWPRMLLHVHLGCL